MKTLDKSTQGYKVENFLYPGIIFRMKTIAYARMNDIKQNYGSRIKLNDVLA